MPFSERSDESWQRLARRVLLCGDPNSGKSFSLRTWPGPQGIIAFPGEKGASSIAKTTVDGKPARIFQWDNEGEVKDWAVVVREIKEATAKLLAEKPATFAGDGLHKLHACFLNEATFGALAQGRDFDPKLYGVANVRLMQYIDMVARSSVENVVFTVWGALEKDDPDEKGTAPSRHIFPDLPGQAAKKIMGEFSMVLYCNRDASGKYIWQTAPFARVWSAGLKLPAEIAARIPLTIAQDWGALSKIIFGNGDVGK